MNKSSKLQTTKHYMKERPPLLRVMGMWSQQVWNYKISHDAFPAQVFAILNAIGEQH